MVWFQCEDCGENLKKPKLPNHFRACSAYKLSCIDCGQMFDRQSVQSHTQCISEAEKYGPKSEGKPLLNVQSKPVKPKPNSDVDINVGLSSRPPWFCSLCNTYTTSQQTLLGHADGKKHRAKARAFHASQKQADQTEEPLSTEKSVLNVKSAEENGSDNKVEEGKKEIKATKKRKLDESTNGEVVQAEFSEKTERKSKKNSNNLIEEDSKNNIKWKKLITSTLKTTDGIMKLKKLQKLIIKSLKESGITEAEEQLQDQLMQKISSSSRFIIENKRVHLVVMAEGQ